MDAKVNFPMQDVPMYPSDPASVHTPSNGFSTRSFPDDIERCRILGQMRPNASLVEIYAAVT